MSNHEKQIKQAAHDAERHAMNCVLLWLAGGTVLELLLLLLNRFYYYNTVAEINIKLVLTVAVKVVAIIAAIISVLCGVMLRRRKTEEHRYLWYTLCIFAAGLSAGCILAWALPSDGIGLMVVIVPVAVILALIFFLYRRDFFLVAVGCTLALAGIWGGSHCARGFYPAFGYLVVFAVVVLSAVLAVFALRLRKNSGKISYGKEKKERRVLPKATSYTFILVTCVLSAALSILSLTPILPMALYGVAVAWTLIMAVWYTVKMV